MSSVPPPGSGYPPPPPPPPQGPPPVMPSGPGLAWETQPLGPESFFDTAKMFITAPDQAWARTRETGDYMRPLHLRAHRRVGRRDLQRRLGLDVRGGDHEDDPAAVRLPPRAARGRRRRAHHEHRHRAALHRVRALHRQRDLPRVLHDRGRSQGLAVAVRGHVPRRLVLVDRAHRLRDSVRRRARRARVADLPHDARASSSSTRRARARPSWGSCCPSSSAASAPRSG